LHSGATVETSPDVQPASPQRVRALRHAHTLERRAKHVVGGETLLDDDPVAEDVRRDLAHVLERHFRAAGEASVRLRGAREVHDPARAHAELHARQITRRAGQIDHVAADFLGKVGRVELVPRVVEADDAEERPNLSEHVRRDALVREVEHLVLALRVRVLEHDLEEEAVELRLGELEHVTVLVRVLRRDHEERVGQLVALALDGHLTLLHRLEQRCLRARRRAVDLVREENIREHGAGEEDLLPHPHRVDTGQLRRGRVRRELNSLERRAEHVRGRAREERLRASRWPLEQHMPASERRDEQQLDRALLSDHDLRDLHLGALAQVDEALVRRLHQQ
jgi:hypothetical protein